MYEETRRSLEATLASVQDGVVKAQEWLTFNLLVVRYYQEWLADPEVKPPSWPFPTLRGMPDAEPPEEMPDQDETADIEVMPAVGRES
jgi:hypothetical protein